MTGRPPATQQNPAGWHATCTKMQADGRICGRWYWYVWVASAGRGKRVEVDSDWEPTSQPHVCRDALNGGEDATSA